MANLATPAAAQDGPDGNLKTVYRDVTFSASYTTGGESITPNNVGMQAIVQCVPDEAKTNNYFSFDYVNSKLQAFVSSTGAEVANATNLSAITVRVSFHGR